jgi:hypothetical protein
MGVYILAVILVLGIPFLLYCLWNFSREIKPRRAPVFFSTVPTWGSIEAMPAPGPRTQDPSLTSEKPKTQVVHRPARDYRFPARVS